MQDLAVAHFTALRDIAAEHEQALFRDFLDYAERHREVISRFGRFPHRNAILGRDSSDAEQSFLQQPFVVLAPPPSLAGAAEPRSAALNLKRSKELDMSLRTPLLIACTVLLAACSPITQENFAKLKPGMERVEVEKLLASLRNAPVRWACPAVPGVRRTASSASSSPATR